MVRKSKWMVALAVVATGAMWLSQSYAQEGGRRQQFDPEQMRQRMEQMRQERAERMREQLGVSADDWQVIGPRIERIEELRGQATMGAMRGGRGFGAPAGGPGGPGGQGNRGGRFGNARPDADPADLPETVRAMQNLREVLDDDQADNNTIKEALTKLRAANEKARKELSDAREDLRTLLTLRQEAQLVAMGILE